MRAALLLATLAVTPALADDGILSFSEALASASTLTVTPLQMPDGSKLWRYVRKQMKGPDVEARLTDVIAQAMAAAHWCENGWEETKRTTASGMLIIEGKCK